MKVSLNWLRDHLDLGARSTEELSDLLTFAGIEVEGVEIRGGSFEHIVAGRILSSEPHPSADRLSVCQVDDGSGPDTPRQVVCGATNYMAGDCVPLALPGAAVGSTKIRKAKLRGVESHGMLCSARELGVSDDADGLWILSEDCEPGMPLSQIVARDTIFDLEITPNRPDLLSHLGLARDLSAILGEPLKGAPTAPAESDSAAADPAKVRIGDTDGCPFYSARWIRGVTVGPSPDWLRAKLEAIGLRPINNVVDITNYVLFETGQPLHAFDAESLDGGIVVRPAAEGESFQALDGETYTLDADDLVIADHAKTVALAGVMGGEETGVTASTTNIILESAAFKPSRIRRTSRRLGLSSDSSYRFERGIDPGQVVGASDLATRLIVELAGGQPDPQVTVAGELPSADRRVPLDFGNVHTLLGVELPAAEIDRILEALRLVKLDDGSWNIPSWRCDLEREVDLIEEVSRLRGLGEVPSTQRGFFAEPSDADAAWDFQMHVRRDLAARGFFEARTIKLISAAQLADALTWRLDRAPVKVKNPLSDDHTTLRTSLLPGLLAVAERNVRMGARALRIFEIGAVFAAENERSSATSEREHLGILVAGDAAAPGWANPPSRSLDAFDLSGILAFLAPRADVTLSPIEPSDAFALKADITVDGQTVGRFVQLKPGRARALGLGDTPAVAAEVSLDKLRAALSAEPVRARDLPRFPAVTRDVAFEAPLDLQNAHAAQFFASAKAEEPLLESVELFDVFNDPSGAKLAADRKSLAYSLTYRHPDRTLTAEEADSAHQKILGKLEQSLPVSIR